MIYLLIFSLSLISSALAINCYKKNKIIFLVFSCIAILLPSILAGLRDKSIGIDVEWYIIPSLNQVTKMSYYDFMASLSTPEYFFYTLIYLVQFLPNPLFWALFFVELLIVTPLYISAFMNRKNVHPTFVLFAFFMLIYNFSFSLMRQFIAASFIVLAISLFYYRKEKVLPLILLICSIFFHSSSVFIILITVLFYLFRRSSVFLFFLSVLMLISIANIGSILLLLSNFSNVFLRYYNSFMNRENESSFFTVEIANFIFLILIYRFLCNRSYLKANKMYLFHLLFLFGVFLSFGSIFSSYVIRFSYYFRFFGIFTLSLPLNKNIKATGDKKIFCRCGIILLLVIYWVYFVVYKNFYNTFPYQLSCY